MDGTGALTRDKDLPFEGKKKVRGVVKDREQETTKVQGENLKLESVRRALDTLERYVDQHAAADRSTQGAAAGANTRAKGGAQ